MSAAGLRSHRSHHCTRAKESEARKVVVTEFISLDGVAQAPGGEKEDASGGFRHGGWHIRYADDVSRARVLGGIAEGSLELVRTLLGAGLVDESRLMIDPVAVGGGKRCFGDDGVLTSSRLLDGRVTSTGAILATYAPAA